MDFPRCSNVYFMTSGGFFKEVVEDTASNDQQETGLVKAFDTVQRIIP